MSQDELAKKVGVSKRSLQYYEAGEIIPFKHVQSIAEATGRSTQWILYGEPEVSKSALEIAVEALEKIRQQRQQ